MHSPERMTRNRSTRVHAEPQRTAARKLDYSVAAYPDEGGPRKSPSDEFFTLPIETSRQKSASALPVVLTPKEAAHRLKLSASWLAKARMRGDGPAYVQVGRAIRYTEEALLQWMKSCTRTSTSQS